KFEACPVCYGTFFDAGEFQDLKEHTVLERFNQMMITISSKFK
ncbi:MAG: zf-TFIIB domain-containing protein, partial [bacterium]